MKLYEYSFKVKRFKQNEKEVEYLRKEYYKRCFELFDSVLGDREKLAQIAKEEQIGIGTISQHAWEYATYELGYSQKEWNQKYLKKDVLDPKVKQRQPMNRTKTNLCLLELKNEEQPEKIIQLIEEHGNLSLLKESVVSFSVVNFPEEKDTLIEDLRRKIKIYTTKRKETIKAKKEELKNEIKKEKENLEMQFYEKNKTLIELVVKGDYESKSDFCTLNHVDINDLENLIEYSKKYDKDTYNQYQTIIAEQRSNRFNKILELVKQLIYYLENGIEDEFGVVRPFDIIDYHLYIGISYEMLRKIIRDNLLTPAELKILRPFFKKNKSGFYHNHNEIKQILDPTSIKIISGIKIEQETKELVLEFFKENKIPGNNVTYNLAIRRYLNNTLQINEKEKNKIKSLREIK